MFSSYKITANVLQLLAERVETVFYRKANNKDRMFVDICKAKISVFPEGTLFANALMSALFANSCCYAVVLSSRSLM